MVDEKSGKAREFTGRRAKGDGEVKPCVVGRAVDAEVVCGTRDAAIRLRRGAVSSVRLLRV